MERRWRRGVALVIDDISASDPREFQDKIKHLGPKRKTNTPNSSYKDNGMVTSDTAFLKQKWKFEFSNLYTPSINSLFDSRILKLGNLSKPIIRAGHDWTNIHIEPSLEQTYQSDWNKQFYEIKMGNSEELTICLLKYCKMKR